MRARAALRGVAAGYLERSVAPRRAGYALRCGAAQGMITSDCGRRWKTIISFTPPVNRGSATDSQIDVKVHPEGVSTLLQRYSEVPVERIRNFSIIAHIDHGKSTLSDKLLESTSNIWPTSKGRQQVMDTLEVERQRGITVKAQTASMVWKDKDGVEYLLNLIDTPGHVDFSYEVSRSLAACQGALLLVDCSQGVQAQTVANHNAAKEAGLKLIPVLTKIDLPGADPEPCLNAMQAAFGFNPEDVIWTSAKAGQGIAEVFPAIVERIPPPGSSGRRREPLRVLLFDSWYDEYRGVVCSVQVVEGVLRPGDTIVAAHSGDKFTVQEVGLMAPAKVPIKPISDREIATWEKQVKASAAEGKTDALVSCRGGLGAGNVGYMIAGMKSTKQALVGDTFFHVASPMPPLPGFRPAKPMVFASLYPVDSGDFNALQTAVERLTLNDASVTVEKESSQSLGFGLRCGFLGLLHMDVFNQRLQSEFQTPVIITSPMVAYKLVMLDGSTKVVERPGDFPIASQVLEYHEPTAHVSIMAPANFASTLMALLAERRGVQEDVLYINNSGAAGASGAAALAAIPTATTTNNGSNDTTSGAMDADAEFEALLASEAAADGADEAADDEDEDEDGDDEEDEFDLDSKGYSGSGSNSSKGGKAGSVFTVATADALSADKVVLKYRVPWAEVVGNMYDQIKSLTAGYASLDWVPGEYQKANIVKVDVLINSKPVDALCFVAHKDKALVEGRKVTAKLKSVISRQQFEIVIQAAIGGKIFARDRIAPYRKDVLIKSGKLVGGGDKSRKQKLLAKQKEGKKRMKTVGNVQLSQEAFHSIMTSK